MNMVFGSRGSRAEVLESLDEEEGRAVCYFTKTQALEANCVG